MIRSSLFRETGDAGAESTSWVSSGTLRRPLIPQRHFLGQRRWLHHNSLFHHFISERVLELVFDIRPEISTRDAPHGRPMSSVGFVQYPPSPTPSSIILASSTDGGERMAYNVAMLPQQLQLRTSGSRCSFWRRFVVPSFTYYAPS